MVKRRARGPPKLPAKQLAILGMFPDLSGCSGNLLLYLFCRAFYSRGWKQMSEADFYCKDYVRDVQEVLGIMKGR